MPLDLIELSDLASKAKDPSIVSGDAPRPGGIDPLGLRQINFSLMDQVFPGINNVARHIRPFTVMAWAWRRAAVVADRLGQSVVSVSVLQDFVARIEVIYAWSQFSRDVPTDIPGGDVLKPLIGAEKFGFFGAGWDKRKEARANSTALSAPVNYGPALRAFGWTQPCGNGSFRATPAVEPALLMLDVALAPYLDHPAFSTFGKVEVIGDDVRGWAGAWALEQPTEVERLAMQESLFGESAPRSRREGVALVIAAARHLGGKSDETALRRAMCGEPGDFCPPAELEQAAIAWRRLQNRQAFRLALEALFYWISWRLVDKGAAATRTLVAEFLAEAGTAGTVGLWMDDARAPKFGPVDWIDELALCVGYEDHWDRLPAAIRGALAACIAEAPEKAELEDVRRLPLAAAAAQAAGWKGAAVTDFLAHVFDSWIFGQHVYWAVGRGLNDNRARGSSILRLKVALEEDGWTLMNGASVSRPLPTPDRLGTMVSLMEESGLL